MTKDLLIDLTLSLPRKDRAHLAEKLLASLDDEQEEIDKAWLEEVERRAAALERGETKVLDGKKALRQLRARLKNEIRNPARSKRRAV